MPPKKQLPSVTASSSVERRRKHALYLGDNLDILRHYIDDATVDLVYLDPPFQSGRDYNLLFKKADGAPASAPQIKAFTDTWRWNKASEDAYFEVLHSGSGLSKTLETIQSVLGNSDMLAYLSMMALRLVELHRVLKATGSLYLHCDPTASHYLKLLLDAVFGPERFVNEVIWKRSGAHSGAKKYGPVHDVLLFYSKGDSYKWNPIYQPLPRETADAWYNNIEPGTGRRFNRDNLTGAGIRTGSSGQPWRGIDPTKKGRHWAIPGFIKDVVGDKDTLEALDALDAAGRIYWPKKAGGAPMLKRYLDESKGVPAQDVITDVSMLNNVDAERLGYPTQKPLALLERIITASSNEGDVILDPFCGCGTTITAAQKLNRRWIGIDIWTQATAIIEKRLADNFGESIRETYTFAAEPLDLEQAQLLASRDRHLFEKWAVRMVGGDSEDKKKGKDRGIDGTLLFRDGPGAPTRKILISVKSGKPKVGELRDLRGTIEREGAAIGVMILLEKPTKEMVKEASDAKVYKTTHALEPEQYPRLQLLTVDELLGGAHIKAPVAFKRKGPARRDPQGKLPLGDELLRARG